MAELFDQAVAHTYIFDTLRPSARRQESYGGIPKE